MGWELIAEFDIDGTTKGNVKLANILSGNKPRNGLKAFKKGKEVGLFKSETRVIKKSRSLHLSFSRVGNEIIFDEMGNRGSIRSLSIFLSGREKDAKGQFINLVSDTDLGFKIDGPIIDKPSSSDRYYGTFDFDKDDFEPINF